MINPINITDTNKEIELSVGLYDLNVLGGWKVETNNFSVILHEVDGDIVIRPKHVFWRIQSFTHGTRAKKIGLFDIPKTTKYRIEFINPEELKVKKSNLMVISNFYNYIPTTEIQIEIK